MIDYATRTIVLCHDESVFVMFNYNVTVASVLAIERSLLCQLTH